MSNSRRLSAEMRQQYTTQLSAMYPFHRSKMENAFCDALHDLDMAYAEAAENMIKLEQMTASRDLWKKISTGDVK